METFQLVNHININEHSSINLKTDSINIYFDPFSIKTTTRDADLIFITHDHYDHLSAVDIVRVANEKTIFVVPEVVKQKLLVLKIEKDKIICMAANEKTSVEINNKTINIEAVASYNTNKNFHKKSFGFLGFIVEVEGSRVFVAGDTDANEDNKNLNVDIAIIPVGGTYTMDYKEAADYINDLKPKFAIPMHYGSIVGDKNDGIKFSELVDNNIRVELKI